MNVRTICLAILYEGDATGYEIRKLSVEGEFSYFLDASFGSIYPALAKLEQEGLVVSHVETQDGRPAKKVYAITEAGRSEFLNALQAPLKDDDYRSEFLMFARFASELPRQLVTQRLDEKMAELDAQLTEMTDLLRKHTSAKDCWIIGFGHACLAAGRDYIHARRGELIDIARADDRRAEAAE